MIDKIVCFREQRLRPSTWLSLYANHFGFDRHTVIFLVKPIEAQMQSWCRGGASTKNAFEHYLRIVNSWAKLADKINDHSFVNYDDFCQHPVEVTAKIWKSAGLREIPFPSEIEWAPKSYKAANSINEARHSITFHPTLHQDRQWGLSPTDEIAASLKFDVCSTQDYDNEIKKLTREFEYPFEFMRISSNQSA